jgi:stage II sporulation protein AA (anti-sigma F factor antagonist)
MHPGLDVLKQDFANGQLAVIKLDGKLSLETVSNFLRSIRPVSAPELVLDMSGVKFLDSAGIGALAQLFVHRRGQGQKFALAGLTQQGKAVMEVSGLLNLLPAYPSVKEAMDQLA